LPHETYKTQDGTLITNYEVCGDEDELTPSYSGGIRGIRELKKQRDILPDVENPHDQYKEYFSPKV
jgi:hypothetical protein